MAGSTCCASCLGLRPRDRGCASYATSVGRIVHLALVLSALSVLSAVVLVASIDSQLDDAWGGDSPDTSFWTLAGYTALIAALPLAVIWLVVGVALIVKGAKTPR